MNRQVLQHSKPLNYRHAILVYLCQIGARGGSRTLSTTLPKWHAAVITTLAYKLERHVGNAPTTHDWKSQMYL